MKKYRLIKEYPGSGYQLNQIIETDIIWINNVKIYLNNHPEFWEEVVEKTYEILSYKSGSFIYKKEDFGPKEWGSITNSKYCSIHSIKRLSDGEVFTIGDKAISKYSNYGNITEFEQKYNNIYITTKMGINKCVLKDLKPVKKPLFKAEDGVDIYEGDEYFELALTFKPQFREAIYECIGRSNINYDYNTLKGKKKLNEVGRYYFSTREAAEEYILMNKPSLSIKEIAPIFGQYYSDNSFSALDRLTTKLKELVKSKL